MPRGLCVCVICLCWMTAAVISHVLTRLEEGVEPSRDREELELVQNRSDCSYAMGSCKAFKTPGGSLQFLWIYKLICSEKQFELSYDPFLSTASGCSKVCPCPVPQSVGGGRHGGRGAPAHRCSLGQELTALGSCSTSALAPGYWGHTT